MPSRAALPAVLARPHVAAMGAVLALAATLRVWQLDQNGDANTYYAAAVHSMLESVSNLVFVSFDAGGLQSVDKPPLALWLQAGSAWVFGFSSWSLLLPQALAGVAAVALLYALVARTFGRTAGVVAALALAVSPVSVAVDRDNNPDALLVLLLVAAVYAGVRAVQDGSARWLVGAGVLVGLAFETKMAVALIVVPGLALAWTVWAPVALRRRLGALALAGGAMLVVGGAWLAAVALTPASSRPWIGGTSDNSALGLLLEYNGFGRLTGQEGGTSNGGFGGILSGGEPGVLRLLESSMADQGSWLLPLAFVGGALAIVLARRRGDRRELAALAALGGWLVVGAVVFSYASGIVHAYYVSAIAPAIAALVGVGAVALVQAVRARPALLAVALAAIGLTAWLQVVLIRRSGYLTWLEGVVVAAALVGGFLLALGRARPALARIGVAVALAGLLVAPAAWARTTLLEPVSGVSPGAGPTAISGLVAGGSGGPGGGGFGGRQRGSGRDGGAPGMAPPAGGGGMPQGQAPAAGGRTGAGTGGIFGGVQGTDTALGWVEANGATARFPLIVQSQQGVAADVIAGSRIAALGGFSGRESAMSAASIAALVEQGDARYVLLGTLGGMRGDTRGTSGATEAIQAVCAVVPADEWSGSDAEASATLYDCAGQAAALRAGAALDGSV